jgi:dTDP-4-dehydrorhamnose reductase
MLEKTPLALWAGIECSVARIGDSYRDQLADTGHYSRLEDLDRVAALGIRTLRYPVLWELISPTRPDHANWGWHDKRLSRLRQLGIAPIAGLLHHGSGPRYTDLLDPCFPGLLADHAGQVAARYPWIEMFTPINEPLTTARFSGMYGHWYPHGRTQEIFLRILVNECRATALAMRAIRAVTPHAQLVQTDDLGKTFSTPALNYQADYENERRWLSFDLLSGRVDSSHFFYNALRDAGISESALAFFLDGDHSPDVFGMNHYLTSERYLDHQHEEYAPAFLGGNGREPYADVEAVRMNFPSGVTGPGARLRELWDRYRRPVAVTEAHHGCTRDEQMRWLAEVWSDAQRLRAEGADVRACTVWAMFGAVDWNSLLIRRDGFYEPGAFDARSNPPRRTAIGKLAAGLVSSGSFSHPVLDRPGWWHRPQRLYRHTADARDRLTCADAPRRLLITGATGTLGRAFSRICNIRGLDHELLRRQQLDIGDPTAIAASLAEHCPWAVINTAGYVRIADAEREPDLCRRENATGAALLADACARLDIPFVTFSSDLVFDGAKGRPYVESDPVCPSGVYGITKAEAERRVQDAHPSALVVRTSAFFGPWDEYNFVFLALRNLAAGREVTANENAVVSPTYVPDLVHATLDLLIDGESGTWHLANQGGVSWYQLAFTAAKRAGLDTKHLMRSRGPASTTVLSSERGVLLPPLENALRRMLNEISASNEAPEPVAGRPVPLDFELHRQPLNKLGAPFERTPSEDLLQTDAPGTRSDRRTTRR